MSADESDEQCKKEELIQREIFGKNYAIEDFSEYIKKITNTVEINLSYFTLAQITQFVQDFQKEIKQSHLQLNHLKSSTDTWNIDRSRHEGVNKKDDIIITKKQGESIWTNLVNPKISIVNTEIHEGGIFSSTYYLFTIVVPDINSECKRRWSDFEWLKKTLEKLMPNTYIPPLPTISFFHKPREETKDKLSRKIQNFCSIWIQNVLVRSTKLFIDFLTLNENQFQDFKADLDQNEAPSSYKKYYTWDGYVDISTSKTKNDTALKIITSIQNKNTSYIRLNSALKDIIGEFAIISSKMKVLSEAFEECAKAHDDNTKIKEIFDTYKTVTETWSNGYWKQNETFKTRFQEFFKYIRLYTNGFIGFYKDYQNSQFEYMSKYVSYDNVNTINKREWKNWNGWRKKYGFSLNRLLTEYNMLNSITSNTFVFQLEKIKENKEMFYQDYLTNLEMIDSHLKC